MSKFFLIVLFVFIILHIVSYYFLIKPMLVSLKGKIIGLIMLVLNYFAIVAFIFVRRFDISDALFIFLSLFILVSCMLASASFINLIFLMLSKFVKLPKILISRILFSLAILGVFLGVYGAYKMPVITKQTIEIPNLKKDMTILQLADLHLSKLISPSKVEKIIELANSTNPDIIVLVGDIIDAPQSHIEDRIELLKKLKAKIGTYFVLGNHEFIFDAAQSVKIIDSLGNIKTLVNANTQIDNNINLIGLSDLSGLYYNDENLKPDFSKAMIGINEDLPNIILSHQPNTIKIIDSSVDLLLSAHTHGGQIFPFQIFAYIFNPFLYGLKTINNTQVYITQGSSVAVTYARLFTTAEINLITLKGVEK